MRLLCVLQAVLLQNFLHIYNRSAVPGLLRGKTDQVIFHRGSDVCRLIIDNAFFISNSIPVSALHFRNSIRNAGLNALFEGVSAAFDGYDPQRLCTAAASCGYENLSYFTRTFRSLFHALPSAFVNRSDNADHKFGANDALGEEVCY